MFETIKFKWNVVHFLCKSSRFCVGLQRRKTLPKSRTINMGCVKILRNRQLLSFFWHSSEYNHQTSLFIGERKIKQNIGRKRKVLLFWYEEKYARNREKSRHQNNPLAFQVISTRVWRGFVCKGELFWHDSCRMWGLVLHCKIDSTYFHDKFLLWRNAASTYWSFLWEVDCLHQQKLGSCDIMCFVYDRYLNPISLFILSSA